LVAIHPRHPRGFSGKLPGGSYFIYDRKPHKQLQNNHMKHMLKVDAIVLMVIASMYLIFGFFSPPGDGTAVIILPISILGILTGSAILEVDRRLNAIESREGKTNQGDE